MGKGCTFYSHGSLRATLKEKNLLPLEQILSIKDSSPLQFPSDSFSTVEVKCNINFMVCDKAIENCKISGKGVRESRGT